MNDEFGHLIPSDAIQRYRRKQTQDPIYGKHPLQPWRYSRANIEVHWSQKHLWEVEDVFVNSELRSIERVKGK